jgi:hypothetical protein
MQSIKWSTIMAKSALHAICCKIVCIQFEMSILEKAVRGLDGAAHYNKFITDITCITFFAI